MDSFILEAQCSRSGKPVFIQYYLGADGTWTRWAAYKKRPTQDGGSDTGSKAGQAVNIDLTGCRVKNGYTCPHCGSTSESECGAQIKKVGGTVSGNINLKQGDSIVLAAAGSNLKKLVVGLGWDPARGYSNSIDCDSAVALYEGQKSLWDFVYFGNKDGKNGTVVHYGDDLTGKNTQGGIDETIDVHLSKIPASVNRIVFLVNIYECRERNQTFGQIENAFIRISNDKGVKLCEYVLKGNYSAYTAIYVGEAYRENGGWSFRARGEGSKATSLSEMK